MCIHIYIYIIPMLSLCVFSYPDMATRAAGNSRCPGQSLASSNKARAWSTDSWSRWNQAWFVVVF